MRSFKFFAGGFEFGEVGGVDYKTNHLLVIGIDKYQDPKLDDLNNAVRDAKEFEEIMRQRYRTENVIALYNEQATLRNIVKSFDDLRQSLSSEHNLIIYFSGHGELVGDFGYWIPSDAEAGERTTYLKNDEVQQLMEASNAHHILVIVDACFSGALLSRTRETVATRYYNIPSRWVMTSGQEEVVPDGLPGHHSPFAKSLLIQLRNFPNEHLGITQLWLSMREGVISNSKQTPLCEPVRNGNHQGGEFYFIDENASGLPVVESSSKKSGAGEIRGIIEEVDDPADLDLESLKNKLTQYMISGATRDAFELLSKRISSDSTHHTTVLMRMASLSKLEKDIAMGIAEDDTREMNRINMALDYVIKNLEEDDLKR